MKSKNSRNRLCAAMLCLALIVTNIMPTGMQAYAKTPEAGTDIVNADYSNEMVSTLTAGKSVGTSEVSVGVNNANQSETGNSSGADTNAGNGANDSSDTSKSDVDTGSGSSDNANTNTDSGDSANTDTGNDSANNDTDNGSGDNANNDTDNGSDDNANTDTGSGSDDNANTDTGSGSSDDSTDTDDTSKGDDEDVEGDTAVDDIPNAEEEINAVGIDIETGVEENTLSVTAYSDSDYLTEDPAGYKLTDITMIPGSYSAEFSAVSSVYVYNDYKILYTTDDSIADDFFRGTSKITASDLSDSSFMTGEFINWNSNSRYENSAWIYDLSGSFTGEGTLTPDTTYYYRLACYRYDSTEHEYCYYFLTVPAQFTTKASVTESAVSIKDISVEDIGYQNAKVVWTVDNPDEESLFDMQLCITDGTADGQSGTLQVQEYKDQYNAIIPNKYYATINLTQATWVKKATAELVTYIGDGERTVIKSDELTITPKDVNDVEINLEEKIGTGTLRVLLTLSPYYTVDSSLRFTMYYRGKGDESWQSTSGYAYGVTGSTSASGTIQISNLSDNTEYEYYIVPLGLLAERTYEQLGSEENPRTFTTKAIVTYEDEDFPDEVFRNYIKTQIKISASDKITSDKLESLTYISYSRNSASGDIRSLEGIEYLENLTSISLEGHAISDLGGLSSLKDLRSITLNYNELTELPDLSGLSGLTSASLNYNRIAESSFTEQKLPASLLENSPNWIENTLKNQRGDMVVTLAPKYYAMSDARPFLIKVTGLKKDYGRYYTLSLTIGDTTVSGAKITSSYYDIYYIKDILKDASGTDSGIAITQDVPCEAVITLTDSYGCEWLEQTAQIIFTGQSDPVVTTQYIQPNASYTPISVDNLPVTYAKENIASITLVDQSGVEVGNASSSSIYINNSYYNAYEDIFGSASIPDLTNGQSIQLSATVYLAKYLTAGEYNAVVTLTDQTSVTFENAVCVDDIAIVNRLYTTGSTYDNYGDYLYVQLNGTNIDPTKVRPVLYEDNKAVTEFVSCTQSSTSYVIYKLKKLEKDVCWNYSGSKTFTYEIETDDGYRVIDNITDKHITVYIYNSYDFVTFEHYNYKKGVYEVKTDSTVANGTDVTVYVYNSSSFSVLMGTAESKVTDSSLSLVFINAQGESYAPPKDQSAYFRYVYTDAEGNEQSFTHTNSSVNWYNYYDTVIGGKSPYSSMIFYHEADLKELDVNVYIPEESVNDQTVVSAQIFSSTGAAIGNSVTLTGESGNGYINYTGTWEDTDGLGEGVYRIRFTAGGQTVYTNSLYVYDSAKFYMNSQSIRKSTLTGAVCVSFYSEQLYGNYIHQYDRNVSNNDALAYWNSGNYKLELFDRFGNSVTGWEIDYASWSYSNFNIYLKNVPEEYVGFYAKITKADQLGVRLDNGNVYYSTAYDASEEYGAWGTIIVSGFAFSSSSTYNAYYGFMSYSYPVSVTVTRPYDTDIICEFTASAPTSGDYYYFTADDLSQTDPNEVYRIVALRADGNMTSQIGYLAAYGSSTVVSATAVSLDKTTLNLQIGQTEQLTAIIEPANTTNKTVTWSSSDTTVATVNAQGIVTALEVGTAVITVTTSNGKTASCEVKVSSYTLDKTELTFELPQDQDKTETIKVMDGDEEADSALVTWSSTDSNVAEVSAAGVVTPKNAGTANILATIEDGPVLICKVTVVRDVESIRMTETMCDLQVGDTKQMQLRFDPSDSDYAGSITWTSTNENVATVDENGLVTAVGAGRTTIDASITVKAGTLSAECEVTVTEVTQKPEEDKIPSGLTALTNEQLTLEDVALPEGWKWSYPDVSLKPFAGMQAKSFAAEYAESGKEPYVTSLPVKMTTVTGIAVGTASGSGIICENDTAEMLIEWKINGSPMDMSSYENAVEWSSNKESVATVAVAQDTKKVILSAKSAGKATITAKVKFAENKTYQVKYNVTVIKEDSAQITAVSVDGFTANEDQTVHQGTVETQTSILHVTMTGASKLTAKSNNTKVVSVGKVTAWEDQYQIPLTIKAAGAATITLTANDQAKTARTIRLDVTDPTPEISESTLMVNLQQTTGTTFFLYPNERCSVKAETTVLDGDNAGAFELRSNDDGSYVIFAKETTKTGSYKLSLKGTAVCDNEEKSYSGVAFTVKVVNQKPKYTVKQSSKVNVFYNDAQSLLNITSDEILENAALSSDCDFTLRKGGDGLYYLAAKTSGQKAGTYNTKGTLTLKFAGYKAFDVSVKVTVENKKPKVALDSKTVTLYPAVGLNNTVVGVKVDGKAYVPSAGSVSLENADRFTIGLSGGKLLLQGNGLAERNESIKASIKIQDTSWSEAISASYTIKIKTGNPTVKLQKSTLQLNTNAEVWAYDTAVTTVMWKDGAAFGTKNVTVVSLDGKTDAILFSYDQDSQQIVAKLNKAVPKGSYKFSVRVSVTDTVTVATTLTVKVVDVAKSKAVKISSKGIIDVLNRTGSYVTVTPSLKSLNGTVKGVSLSGRAGHLFRAECEDGKIRIYAKEDEALITKYAYKVNLNLVIENADGSTMVYTTPDITLKLKQGKPKVTITMKNATFFSGAYNTVTRQITTTLKGAENPVIENVELMNNQSAFVCGYEDGVLTLQNTKGAVKGKSYSLQLKVTFAGQADNEKAVTVKYAVKVK